MDQSEKSDATQNVKQYPYSVKIEDSREGPRVTVHVYADGYTQVKDEALRIYWATKKDLQDGKILSVSPDDYPVPDEEKPKVEASQ